MDPPSGEASFPITGTEKPSNTPHTPSLNAHLPALIGLEPPGENVQSSSTSIATVSTHDLVTDTIMSSETGHKKRKFERGDPEFINFSNNKDDAAEAYLTQGDKSTILLGGDLSVWREGANSFDSTEMSDDFSLYN